MTVALEALRDEPRWVAWKNERRGLRGDVAKIPHAAGGHKAKVIHPRGSGPPELWFLHTRRTAMARKSYKPEEIVAKLRQVDVLSSQGQSVAAAIRSIGVSEVTYYRWRQEYDDMAG